MVGGGGVVGVVPGLRMGQVVGGAVPGAAAVTWRHRGGGRDHAQGPVKT